MSRHDLDEVGTVDLARVTRACLVEEDPGAIVRHARPMTAEERIARLSRDDDAVAQRERRIAIEHGRVTPFRVRRQR